MAFINILKLKNQFGAIWVGEPSSQTPNSYGEQKRFNLPNSNLLVLYSTKKYELIKGKDQPFVPVDFFVTQTFAETIAGRDKVLEAVVILQINDFTGKNRRIIQ